MPPRVRIPGDSLTPGPGGELLDLFVERVADYRAVVVRCLPGEVAGAVRQGLGSSMKVVVPEGFPSDWVGLPDGVTWPKVGKLSSIIVQSLKQNASAKVAIASTSGNGVSVTISFARPASSPQPAS